MIASLPMYWREENAHVWRALWNSIKAPDFPDLTAPDELPDDLYQHWLNPDLALSMTCGLPFRTKLKGKTNYVGTLTFGANSPAGHYKSVAIAKRNLRDDNQPLRLAYNARDSQSGWAASFDPSFEDLKSRATENVETGAHAASFEAVLDERADFAFLDEVTWKILQKFDPQTQEIMVLGETTPTPTLPLITSLKNDVKAIRETISKGIENFKHPDVELIGGEPQFHVLSEQEYYALPTPPAV